MNHLRCNRLVLIGKKRVRNEEAEGSNPFSSTKFL
jgi:hypothetical protein